MGIFLGFFFPYVKFDSNFWEKFNNFLISQSWKKKTPDPSLKKKKGTKKQKNKKTHKLH
jgi:hypothetical protein